MRNMRNFLSDRTKSNYSDSTVWSLVRMCRKNKHQQKFPRSAVVISLVGHTAEKVYFCVLVFLVWSGVLFVEFWVDVADGYGNRPACAPRLIYEVNGESAREAGARYVAAQALRRGQPAGVLVADARRLRLR